MQKKWWKETAVYQIYPKSFLDTNGDGIGDINGIISKLDYIKKLGAETIWLSPINESPDKDNGYDISDYYAISDKYGTLHDFKRLINEAHKRGLKILLDLVVNHTSSMHKWFLESKKGVDNPYRNYYIWKNGKNGGAPNNWGALFGGSAWTKEQGSDEYYLGLFSPHQPDLNWDNPEVRSEIYKMMRYWLDLGVDGFRMDVISLISKPEGFPDSDRYRKDGYASASHLVANGKNVHKYLQEMNREVLRHYDTFTVGEASGVTVEEAAKYTQEDRKELDTVFQFELVDIDGGETDKWGDGKIDFALMKKTISKWQIALEHNGWNSLFWCNHDQPRVVSRFGKVGDRKRIAKLLATALYCLKGIPFIYQGEEIGMTNCVFNDISELRDIESINAYKLFVESGMAPVKALDLISRRGRDSARTPMQWDESENAGFTGGTPWIKVNPNYAEINVKRDSEETDSEESVFSFYQKLLSLKKQNEVLIYGGYREIFNENPYILAYERKLNDKKIIVICNFSDERVVLEPPKSINHVLLCNISDSSFIESGSLAPLEAIVFSK